MKKLTLSCFILCCLIQCTNKVFSSPENFFWKLPVPLQGSIPEQFNSPAFDVNAQQCGYCHKQIYDQWSTSRHAKAMGPGVLGQLPAFDKNIANDCLNCHAPRIEQQNQWKSDNSKQLQGVDCSSCHLRSHVRFGPENNALTPHGEVKKLTLFGKSDFCSVCHQFDNSGILVNGKLLENTYEEWKVSRYAQEGKQCQDCHMRDNHSFKGIHDKQMTREGLGVKVERKFDTIHLQATNIGAGHALPTYITPRIRLRIKTVVENQQVEYLIHRKMKWSVNNGWQEIVDTRLLPDQSITLKLPVLPTQSAIAEVIVEPDADYYERVYPYLITELSEQLDNISIQQLKSARDCSGQSIYVLYSYECPSNSNVCIERNP